jgi:hypothetical protein
MQRALAAGFAAALAGTVTACALGGSSPATVPASSAEANPSGDIPDNQAYVKYSDPSGHFSIALPEGWARSASAGSVTFSDKLNSVRIASSTGPQPTAQTAEAAAVKTPIGTHTSAAAVSTAQRRSGAAVVVSYQSDAPANAVTGRVARDEVQSYTFWRNGIVVEVALAAPVGADNVDPWRMITDSFTWTGR